MSDAIRIEVSPDAAEIARTLSPQTALRAIAKAMDKANELALGQIMRNRFSGKGPFPVGDHRLGVRTNRLRSSLRRTRAVIEGDQVTSSMGSNVRYFGVHELGFSGSVTVRAHQRRAPQGDRFDLGSGSVSRYKASASLDMRTKKGREKAAAMQTASGIARVKAHQRKVNIPERRPLRTGIEENASIYEREISAALSAAFEGGSK